MSRELWQDVIEICGGGTRCHVALRQTSAERVTGWRGSSPLTQFGTFFIHFHQESCCLKPWQREVTDAHKAKATTLPATLRLTQKPRQFVRLSFSSTSMHRIFCKAILPQFYHPAFHVLPSRQFSCLPPSADPGQSRVSVEGCCHGDLYQILTLLPARS